MYRSSLPRGVSLGLSLAYIAIVAALIALRTLVNDLDFVSVGWIFVLSLVPLLPWLIPALVPVAERVAPFVRSVKLPGGIEISLSAASRPAAALGQVERTLTSDHLVHGLLATSQPFTTTDALTLIEGVRAVRSSGAAAVVTDLEQGSKWRLPNLYFLAWILANDPATRWIVFTETRGDTTGAFVGICAAPTLCESIEVAHPAYGQAQLEFSDPTLQRNQQELANEFNKLRATVAPPQAGELPTLGWVTSAELRRMLGPHLSMVAVDWTSRLDRAGLETIVGSTAPYVAATNADGRFRGLIEQREVVLEVARRVLQADQQA
jgi:hypothetical protein